MPIGLMITINKYIDLFHCKEVFHTGIFAEAGKGE